MTAATHYENANFLRELAENLPRILPSGSAAKAAARADFLQRLADEELAQAEYDEWVRAKVAAARADQRPGVSTDQLRARLQARYQELNDASPV